jgi:hypothetical protein
LHGIEQRLRAKLADWRGLLTRNVESGREVLRTLLVGPLRFTPVIDGQRRGYRFTGAIALDRIVAGIVDLPLKTRGGLASPAGFDRCGNAAV